MQFRDLARGREYLPFAWDALERQAAAAVAKAHPGAGHPEPATRSFTVSDTRTSPAPASAAPRADANGDPTDIVADHRAFAGRQPGADFDVEQPDLLRDGTGAANAARRTVEGGEKAVAGRFISSRWSRSNCDALLPHGGHQCSAKRASSDARVRLMA
jgi:hypothetical protein